MNPDVRRIHLWEACLERRIDAEVTLSSRGLHASIYGGDRPHIGAVSVADPDGGVHTTLFAGHRDDAISRAWAEAFAKAGHLPAVVEAGVHYDAISSEGIQEVLAAADRLLERVLRETASL